MGRVVRRTSCGASFGDVGITDLDFADDAVILTETIKTLTVSLKTWEGEDEGMETFLQTYHLAN